MTESLGIGGLAFPLSFDGSGKLRLSRDSEHIKHSVQQILLTRRGSLPFSEFGSRVPDRVFDSVNSTAMIGADAEEAISRFERRVFGLHITAVSSLQPGTVCYDVNYREKTTQQQQRLTVEQGR